jgi:hypothetical protein
MSASGTCLARVEFAVASTPKGPSATLVSSVVRPLGRWGQRLPTCRGPRSSRLSPASLPGRGLLRGVNGPRSPAPLRRRFTPPVRSSQPGTPGCLVARRCPSFDAQGPHKVPLGDPPSLTVERSCLPWPPAWAVVGPVLPGMHDTKTAAGSDPPIEEVVKGLLHGLYRMVYVRASSGENG